MDPPSRKRAKQPLERIEGAIKRAKHGIMARFNSEEPSTSSGTLPHTSSHFGEQSNNVPIAGSRMAYSPQLVSSMEEDIPGVSEPGPSAPTTRFQATDTDLAPPTKQLTTQYQDPGYMLAPEQTHRGPSRQASIKTGSNEVAAGHVEQAAGTLKTGPLEDISDLLQDLADMNITEGTVNEKYEALQQRLQTLLKVLEKYSGVGTSPAMMSKINDIRGFIEGELSSLGNEQSGEQHRLLLGAQKEDDFQACYRRIQDYVNQLALDTHLSMLNMVEEQSGNHLSTNLRISRIEEEQSKDRMSSWISRLPSSPSAWYDSYEGAELKRRGCTLGTRVGVLDNLLDWATNDSVGGVYWLNGMAGTGKTTIAYSVCERLAEEHKLAASFFCSRLRGECRDVKMIIPSISYQLAQRSPSFQSALSVIMKNDPDAHQKLLNLQFKALIEEPLLAAHPPLPKGLVVVIDALDECDDKESTGTMLDVLLGNTVELSIKFIISSRPEPEIRDQMSVRARSRLVLHELDRGQVQADIEMYLRESLAQIEPSDTEIAALVQRAGILFIYAATAVRYIGPDNPRRNPISRLGTILQGPQGQNTKENKEINQLYTTILEAAFEDEELEEAERVDMQQVLYTVICAREPLTVKGLSGLLRMTDVGRVRAALSPMWSVLHVVETSELVMTLHASFPDFMFSSTRSKAFHCDFNAHNLKLAGHCFGHIARTIPQFNLCGLESSYLPDDKVPNMKERVSKAISLELLYACRYWADHVEAGKCASSVADRLQEFLSTRLLLWMEVLNLSKQMKAGTDCMKLMVEWCNKFEEHQELVELAHDAKRFVETFSSNPVSRSTPHIYVSTLTFWPRAAPITEKYAKYTRGPAQVEGTALDRRQLAHLSKWAFEKRIEAMAVSPDGLYVALGIGSDVLVVDSSSGKKLLGPLKGHEGAVESIAFSPDGSRIFAGSTKYNKATIVGWDTRTGDIEASPLELQGHTRDINCLSFSPDCSCVATGSDDETACLWSTESGNMLLRLATQGEVYHIVYSPNGTRIAAQIGAASLQVWDSQTGNTILGLLTGPVSIDQIAFSEFVDQSRIIYISGHNTLYVWDAQTGEKVLGPIEGHTDGITCISHSPDGRYIVSGFVDRTIRLWDAQNCNLVLGPLEAHTDRITSVAFSPDGSRIISACEGGLVCTWDARQRNLTSNSTNAPFDWITRVKFSSDGACFVSGSDVGTICIWNAHNGEMAVGPINAHASEIEAVDFLNDRVVSYSEDGEICVCDARTGEAVLGPLLVYGEGIRSIAFSPSGELIATGSEAEVEVWDAQTGSRVIGPLTDLDRFVTSLQFSPDGTRIVGGSWGSDKNIAVWDGSWGSDTTGDENIAVWDVSDGKNLFGTLDGHSDSVRSVSYSPNGALIASGSDDKTIIIWDAYTGKKALGPLTGHSLSVQSVDFSPDSTRLVSGSGDRTIRIWDVRTGEMMFKLLNGHEDYIRSVEYSPDGTRILSRSDDMSVRIHDAQSPEERALSRSESEVGDWTMDKDGWVVGDQGRLLVWVPGDLRRSLLWPRTEVIVAPYGFVRLRFDKSHMGESWAKGFTSDS